MKHELRTLVPGDEAALEGFLAGHAESSMFLRANSRRAGLVDGPHPYQGAYVGAVDGRAVLGVVAHFWNGMIVVQAPDHVEALVPLAVVASGRKVVGMSGPGDQVRRARRVLGMDGVATTEDGMDDLFALDLAALQVPAALAAGRLVARHPAETEIGLITEWSIAFNCEALGFAESEALRRYCAELMGRMQAERAHFVLAKESSEPVAYAAFNASLPDMVQIGGVWTPPGKRGKGYARSVVAGALVAARDSGVRRAVLFTDIDNHAAQAVYRSLGFARIGDYGIVIFA